MRLVPRDRLKGDDRTPPCASRRPRARPAGPHRSRDGVRFGDFVIDFPELP